MKTAPHNNEIPEMTTMVPPVEVPLPELTQDDMIKTLEHHANYYKQRADELEQKLVLTQCELKRHATARIRAETELQMLKAAPTETKQ